jgi:sulfatase maturation enzyme AslB (radical SAM superfamily)
MNVIQQPNKEILLLLGKHRYFKNHNYRLNKFCLVDELEDGTTLIFNTMTRAMVSIGEHEKDLMYVSGNDRFNFLFDNYFIVKDDYDEEAEVDRIRFTWAPVIDDRYIEERYSFLIVTTTGCNARCFYCYERHMSKVPMTLKTAEDVVNYILKKAKDPNKIIHLDWFGGEPLFNMKVIDYICQRLTDEGRTYNSSMISNGYLFDEKVVEKATDFWKLGHVQITLDGTEDIYNKAKNYIYKNQDEVSPYKKVIHNIELLLNKNF